MSLKETFEKLHLSKNKEHDLQVAEYLGKIAEEAACLAKIWENVTVSVLANQFIKAINAKYGASIQLIDASKFKGIVFP